MGGKRFDSSDVMPSNLSGYPTITIVFNGFFVTTQVCRTTGMHACYLITSVYFVGCAAQQVMHLIALNTELKISQRKYYEITSIYFVGWAAYRFLTKETMVQSNCTSLSRWKH